MAVASASPAAGAPGQRTDVGTLHASAEVERGQLPLASATLASTTSSGFSTLGRAGSQASAAVVGDTKIFLILDDVADQYLFTTFTLRGVGEHIEIWVQNNLRLPRRRLPQRRRPERRHDAQVNTFDPRVRHEHLPEGVGGVQRAARPRRVRRAVARAPRPAERARDHAGLLRGRRRQDRHARLERAGRRTTTTPNNASRLSYIAGFFSSQLNGFFDRNVMTIDAFDWLHRTGAEPAGQPGSGRPLHERAGAAVPLRGRLRARVPAPARVLRGPRRGQLDQRGPRRLGADPHRLRQSGDCRSRTRASTATSSASSAGSSVATPVNPNPPSGVRSRELAHALGGPGRRPRSSPTTAPRTR